MIVHKKVFTSLIYKDILFCVKCFKTDQQTIEKVKKYDLNCLRFEYFNGSRDKAA